MIKEGSIYHKGSIRKWTPQCMINIATLQCEKSFQKNKKISTNKKGKNSLLTFFYEHNKVQKWGGDSILRTGLMCTKYYPNGIVIYFKVFFLSSLLSFHVVLYVKVYKPIQAVELTVNVCCVDDMKDRKAVLSSPLRPTLTSAAYDSATDFPLSCVVGRFFSFSSYCIFFT